jgi:excisionase family DNA binding protein
MSDVVSAAAPTAEGQIERLAYSPTELAQALGCTRQHIQNLIARGEIDSIKLGRKRLIPRHVVDKLLDGQAESGRHR